MRSISQSAGRRKPPVPTSVRSRMRMRSWQPCNASTPHTTEADAGLTDSEMTPRSLREVEAEAVALVCLEALGLPGADCSRGYIQSWNAQLGAEPIPERSAQRIFKAADQILKAGTCGTGTSCSQ